MNLLFRAILDDDRALVEKLLAEGARVNEIDPDGRNALVFAYQCRFEPNLNIVDLLIQYHADPNQVDRSGRTVWTLIGEKLHRHAVAEYESKQILFSSLLLAIWAVGGASMAETYLFSHDRERMWDQLSRMLICSGIMGIYYYVKSDSYGTYRGEEIDILKKLLFLHHAPVLQGAPYETFLIRLEQELQLEYDVILDCATPLLWSNGLDQDVVSVIHAYLEPACFRK